jgi:hypothetical protein
MTFPDSPSPDPRCTALVRQLRSAFNAAAHLLTVAGGRPLQAYLALENWHANALTAAIDERHPAMAEERTPAPDRHFKHREEDAPCLLPLPQGWAAASTDSALMHLLAHDLPEWLKQAWSQAEQRQMRQPLCGVLFSESVAVNIANHWADLGDQLSPEDGGARLFRYQDPRVMQRAWPLLSDAQRQQWLGPVRQWWALEQPWRPWSSAELMQQDPIATSREPEWFQASVRPGDAKAPRAALNGRLTFDLAQWHAAHSAPAGHRVWASLAGDDVPINQQPDGAAMSLMLAQGQHFGLSGYNLEDFVAVTWRMHASADSSPEVLWQSARATALLDQILDTLRRQPEARFGTLYAEALPARQER